MLLQRDGVQLATLMPSTKWMVVLLDGKEAAVVEDGGGTVLCFKSGPVEAICAVEESDGPGANAVHHGSPGRVVRRLLVQDAGWWYWTHIQAQAQSGGKCMLKFENSKFNEGIMCNSDTTSKWYIESRYDGSTYCIGEGLGD